MKILYWSVVIVIVAVEEHLSTLCFGMELEGVSEVALANTHTEQPQQGAMAVFHSGFTLLLYIFMPHYCILHIVVYSSFPF